MNMQIGMSLYYQKQLETGFLKIPFIIASIDMNNLRINLTKDASDQSNENYKINFKD